MGLGQCLGTRTLSARAQGPRAQTHARESGESAEPSQGLRLHVSKSRAFVEILKRFPTSPDKALVLTPMGSKKREHSPCLTSPEVNLFAIAEPSSLCLAPCPAHWNPTWGTFPRRLFQFLLSYPYNSDLFLFSYYFARKANEMSHRNGLGVRD